ncbi:MAG: hypothetical protein M3Q03_00175, partial [Chloroflexota bacterium]|nr:hypothetical protein [Chloroflexota bacterium]
MGDGQGETTDILVAEAAKQGHGVSRAQLKRWHAAGLLPRPHRRSLGKGRGTTTIYPQSTAAQLLRLLEIRAEGRRFDPEQALWRLWWEKWPIELGRVRTLLAQQVETQQQALFDVRHDSEGREFLDRFSEERLPRTLGRARKRAGTTAFPTAAYLLFTVADGTFGKEWQDRDDARTLFRALGLEHAIASLGTKRAEFESAIAPSLQHLAEASAPAALREALATATDADLIAARDELRELVGITREAWGIIGPLLTPSNAGRDLLGLPPHEAVDLLPGGMLLWLSLRRRPPYAHLY